MGEGGTAATHDAKSSTPHSNAPSIILTPSPHVDASQVEKSSDKTTPPTSRSSSRVVNDRDFDSSRNKTIEKRGIKDDLRYVWRSLYKHIDWILPVLKDWSKMKPVLRSAIMAWICMIMLLIHPVEVQMGGVSFLILLSAFITPTELPILGVIERELYILLLTTIAWAYSNLAIFFAHLARKNRLSPAETREEIVYSGGYIEAAPTAICATFLGIGAACALYLKIKFGPSPFFFASILACVALDIALVYDPLFPYPTYSFGQLIVIPLSCKAAISITVSFLFYPKSVNSAFVERLIAVVKPLHSSADQMLEILEQSPDDPNFDFDMMHNQVMKTEAGLAPLRAASRLVNREINFSLANADDLNTLLTSFRGIVAPADGVSYYFSCIKADMKGIDIHWHPHMAKYNTPLPSRPATPARQLSTPGKATLFSDIERLQKTSDDAVASAISPHSASTATATATATARLRRPEALRSESPASSIRRQSHELRHRVQAALHPLSWGASHKQPIQIGLWESLRYAAIESQIHSRVNDQFTTMCFTMLSQASRNLVFEQGQAYQSAIYWLSNLNGNRLKKLKNSILFMSTKNDSGDSIEEKESGQPKSLSQSVDDLHNAIEEFKDLKKKITEPFRCSVERQAERNGSEEEEVVPHRYLFQSFTYCYFQILYSSRLLAFIQECEKIDQRRSSHWKLHFPGRPRILTMEAYKSFFTSEEDPVDDHDDEEDFKFIPGMVSSLGMTRARDPEVMFHERTAWWQKVGMNLSQFNDQLFKGNALFMWKAGIVTVLVALPSLLSSSAGWCYENKAIWTIIMAQLCTARHRGQVLFNLINRFIATLAGAVIGMLIWYIASGNGVANPYAMTVVTAPGFVGIMIIRLYLPSSPVTVLITCMTAALVIGYSWKDSHNPTFGAPGIGWDIAWRRFTEVVIGCTAAYIMAVLPPSSSMRKYYRLSHANTLSEIGGAYCQVREREIS